MPVLTFRELALFWRGRLGKTAAVAELPLELGKHLGAIVTDVCVEVGYAHKLRHKHHLRLEHYHTIQLAINFGYCGLHRGDLIFIYRDETIHGQEFQLVIKQAMGGTELWIKTFHPTDPGDIERVMRQAQEIRPHS